jgi:hypothetical protein
MPRSRSTSVASDSVVPAARVERAILRVRGQNVLLDEDLAQLYGTSTKRVNEQVRRNAARFPRDFAFRLTGREWANLRSHLATSNADHGGRRYAPFVFTEHGAVRLANVLSTPRAVSTGIQVVRTFIRLREMLASHRALVRRLDELERRYDRQFKCVFDAIRDLMEPAVSKSPQQIGFRHGRTGRSHSR